MEFQESVWLCAGQALAACPTCAMLLMLHLWSSLRSTYSNVLQAGRGTVALTCEMVLLCFYQVRARRP